MNNNQQLITIIVPSYNHEKYIIECLSEVVKINLPKKIIIIDDGSTDNTSKIVKDFIDNNKLQNIEFIEKENSGLVSSLNMGLELCQSKYIYIVASDDIPNPKGIKESIAYLEDNPSVDFFIGGGKNFFEDGKQTQIYTKKHEDFFMLHFEKRLEELFLNYPSPLLLQSTIFKTELLKKIRGWDTSLIWDDYPMFVKLLSNQNHSFIFNPLVETVLYRHHGVNRYKNIEKQFYMVCQALDKLAPKYLKNKAIGNRLGYYSLKALFQVDIKTFVRLLSLSPVSSYPYMIQKVFIIVYCKFKGILKK